MRATRTTVLGAALGVVLLAVIALFSLKAVGSSAGPSGPRWQAAGLQGTLVHSLALGRRAGLRFAASHGGIYRRQGGRPWRLVLASGDVWGVDLLPDGVTVVAADNDGQVEISHDAGSHWRRVLLTPQGVYAVTAVPGNPHLLLAGAGGGIYLSRDGGLHWQRRLALPHSAGAAFTWLPGSRRTVFAGAVAGEPGGSTAVFVSRDAGVSWHTFGHGLHSEGGIMSLAAAPAAGILTGTMGNAIWKASTRRRRWHQAASGMPSSNDHVTAILPIPHERKMIFAATLCCGVFRSTDAGNRWITASTGLPAAHNATIVLSLAYDQRRQVLYAGTADGVYRMAVAGAAKGRRPRR